MPMLRRGLYLFVAWVLGGTSEADIVEVPRSFFVELDQVILNNIIVLSLLRASSIKTLNTTK